MKKIECDQETLQRMIQKMNDKERWAEEAWNRVSICDLAQHETWSPEHGCNVASDPLDILISEHYPIGEV